ncbi:hypothetical protein QYF36_003334 [Acer negundo]|nr:hypothetical protein QYF36_003334 [Acer negundo]
MGKESREVWANVRSRKDVRKTNRSGDKNNLSRLREGKLDLEKKKSYHVRRVGSDSSTTSSDSQSEERQLMGVGKSKGECSKWRLVSKGSESRGRNGLEKSHSGHGLQKTRAIEKRSTKLGKAQRHWET